MDESPISRKRELVATLAVLLVIVAIVGAVTVTHKKKIADSVTTMPGTTTADPATTTSTSTDTTTATSSASFKDGQYGATGSYQSPGGSEEISVTITLKNGVITETSAKTGATDAEAEEYQNKFINDYKALVVSKNISDVTLNRVSGSSLTSIGFNSAINQIKSQAKA